MSGEDIKTTNPVEIGSFWYFQELMYCLKITKFIHCNIGLPEETLQAPVR
jgi:hypothetical protein